MQAPSAPVVAPTPTLHAMSAADFAGLMSRLRSETWEETRLKMIGDQLASGSLLDRAQAKQLVGLFKWDENRIEAIVAACSVMTEAGALPELIATLKWDSSQDTLRKRTNGRCEYVGR